VAESNLVCLVCDLELAPAAATADQKRACAECGRAVLRTPNGDTNELPEVVPLQVPTNARFKVEKRDVAGVPSRKLSPPRPVEASQLAHVARAVLVLGFMVTAAAVCLAFLIYSIIYGLQKTRRMTSILHKDPAVLCQKQPVGIDTCLLSNRQTC